MNVARGLRAVGYLEPDPLPAGPVALVTHSGSVFSALLRARRGFGFTVAVSGRSRRGRGHGQAGRGAGRPARRRRPGHRGPLLVIGAGGIFVEIFSERAVLLAPVTRAAALAAVRRLRIAPVLAGSRGRPAADLDAIADAITGLSRLACDLGDVIGALDINPLICGPGGAIAADVLVVPG